MEKEQSEVSREGLTSHLTKHIIGHFEDGFCGSNDPINSVKALKEVVVLSIGFNPTRSTSPCYKPTVSMHTTHSNTQHKNELSTVKWAQ